MGTATFKRSWLALTDRISGYAAKSQKVDVPDSYHFGGMGAPSHERSELAPVQPSQTERPHCGEPQFGHGPGHPRLSALVVEDRADTLSVGDERIDSITQVDEKAFVGLDLPVAVHHNRDGLARLARGEG